MTEQVKTISEARQSLPKLSQAAQSRMARVLITNQGKPQSVLLGYNDYRGLVASVELANRPEEMQKIRDRLREDKWITFEQLQAAVKKARESSADRGMHGAGHARPVRAIKTGRAKPVRRRLAMPVLEPAR